MEKNYYLKHFGLTEEALRMVLSNPLAWCLLPIPGHRNLLYAALAGVVGYCPKQPDAPITRAHMANLMGCLSFIGGIASEHQHVSGRVSIGYRLDTAKLSLLQGGISHSTSTRKLLLTLCVPTNFAALRAIPSCEYIGTGIVRGVAVPPRHVGETIHSEAAFGATYRLLCTILRETCDSALLNGSIGQDRGETAMGRALADTPKTAGLVLLQVPLAALPEALRNRADYELLRTVAGTAELNSASRVAARWLAIPEAQAM